MNTRQWNCVILRGNAYVFLDGNSRNIGAPERQYIEDVLARAFEMVMSIVFPALRGGMERDVLFPVSERLRAHRSALMGLIVGKSRDEPVLLFWCFVSVLNLKILRKSIIKIVEKRLSIDGGKCFTYLVEWPTLKIFFNKNDIISRLCT